MWASYFLKAQGYNLRRNIFYQDNTSAINMLRNGKASCGSKSRHIHIRYFFTKDVINRENMELMHCSTDNMVADFYTKPLQGEHYYKLRQIIMGHDTMPVEERVSDSEKVTTEHGTGKTISRKQRTLNHNAQYKVSNNFN